MKPMTANEFYRHFEEVTPIIQGFAYKLTNSMEEARDLYQETAYRALKNKEKFRPNTNFKAWTMTIMKNIFINAYRKKKKKNTLIDQTDNNYYINSGGPTVHNGSGSNIMMQELLGMVDALDESLRIPFLMHYQGYKYKEIAEHLDLPLGTVKSRIFFARKELKENILERYENVEMVMG